MNILLKTNHVFLEQQNNLFGFWTSTALAKQNQIRKKNHKAKDNLKAGLFSLQKVIQDIDT